MKKKLKSIYKKGKEFVEFGISLISTTIGFGNSTVDYLDPTYNHVTPKEETLEAPYINRELTTNESLLDSNRQVGNVKIGNDYCI